MTKIELHLQFGKKGSTQTILFLENDMKNTLMIFGLVGLMTTSPLLMTNAQAQQMESRQDAGLITSFCRDRLVILKNAYRIAEIESQAGNTQRSLELLEKGLVDAYVNINPRFQNTLTSKAIARGIKLLVELKRTPDNKQKVRAINHFLFNYFLFIENVSNRLDIPYFQPGSAFSRVSASNIQFEKLFTNFASDQVQMILDTMSTQADNVIYPIGSTELLLTALKVTTSAMANDLSESIFAARYACSIESLKYSSQEIAYYLATHSTYGDDYTAVQELVGSVKRALRSHCTNNNYEINVEAPRATTDAINRPFTLNAGTTEQVRLRGEKYIKKLIISAEGIRSDAMFDIVINGDVKGTVYVPGRDPSYFVTVEDYSDSIEFVSRNGSAIISRILVVAE